MGERVILPALDVGENEFLRELLQQARMDTGNESVAALCTSILQKSHDATAAATFTVRASHQFKVTQRATVEVVASSAAMAIEIARDIMDNGDLGFVDDASESCGAIHYEATDTNGNTFASY